MRAKEESAFSCRCCEAWHINCEWEGRKDAAATGTPAVPVHTYTVDSGGNHEAALNAAAAASANLDHVIKAARPCIDAVAALLPGDTSTPPAPPQGLRTVN
jgi:hypothetical protein